MRIIRPFNQLLLITDVYNLRLVIGVIYNKGNVLTILCSITFYLSKHDGLICIF